MFCNKCGAELPPDSEFCPVCGRHLDATVSVLGKTVPTAPVINADSLETYSPYLTAGTILQGKYRIDKVIGKGGFGITYKGTDLKLDMHIAIKEYFPDMIAQREMGGSSNVTCTSGSAAHYEQGMNNFLKEARNMAKFVSEDSFISVHDHFSEHNTAYIIMEFVEGVNLKQYLAQHGRLSLDETLQIMHPVMHALEKIHAKGMIHRDVSPSNIMIRPDGRVKLLDFGAVMDTDSGSQKLTSMSAVYKKGYSPIEQQTNDMEQGPYSDVYAVCATMYEMLTGKVPADPLTRLSGKEALVPPTSLGAAISREQEAALLQGMEIFSRDRLQTIPQLERALTKEETDDPPGRNPVVRRPILAGVIIVLLLAAGCLYLVSGRQTQTEPVRNVQAVSKGIGETSVADIGYSAAELADSSCNMMVQMAQAAEDEAQQAAEAARAAEEAARVAEEAAQASKDKAQAETEQADDSMYQYPADAMLWRGHHYYIYDDGESSWDDAMDKCRSLGGYLAVINDSDENEWLFQYMVDQGHDEAFFGLLRDEQDDSWGYIYGDSSSFLDWGTNSKGILEPNNSGGKENHAELDVHMHDGHWNDASFGKKVYTPEGEKYKDRYTYICEWDG